MTSGRALPGNGAARPASAGPTAAGSAAAPGYLRGWATLLARPVAFFARVRTSKSDDSAFFLLLAWALGMVVISLARLLGWRSSRDTTEFLLFRLGVAAVLAPFVLAACALCASVVHHLLLRLLRGASAGFGATRRVVVYALSVGFLVVGIPEVGVYLGLVWYLVLVALGLRVVHGTTLVRAAIAAVAPLLLCAGGMLRWINHL